MNSDILQGKKQARFEAAINYFQYNAVSYNNAVRVMCYVSPKPSYIGLLLYYHLKKTRNANFTKFKFWHLIKYKKRYAYNFSKNNSLTKSVFLDRVNLLCETVIQANILNWIIIIQIVSKKTLRDRCRKYIQFNCQSDSL